MWRTILYGLLILLFGCDLPDDSVNNSDRLQPYKQYRSKNSNTPNYLYDPNTNVCSIFYSFGNASVAANVDCEKLPMPAKKYFGFVVEEEKKCP